MCVCFFFQAEDGIRDRDVTGVQTCALPISSAKCKADARPPGDSGWGLVRSLPVPRHVERIAGGRVFNLWFGRPERAVLRSEERRVGKEGSTWGLRGA